MTCIKAAMLALGVAMPMSASATTDDFQAWTAFNITGNLSPKIVANLELQGRFVDDASRLGVVIVRPSIGLKISDAVVLHLGYAHQTTIQRGTRDINENRWYQQTSWRVGKIGSATVNSRTRIELRTVERARDTGWRLRQRVQLQFPLRVKGAHAIAQSESFFALNSTDWGARAGFDQVRNFIGVAFPLSARLQAETGFQHRYQRRVGAADRSDFIVPLTLTLKL